MLENDMTVKKLVRNKTDWLTKLLGHRMGTRMTGLAPRPPFFSQANFGLGPTSGLSRFSLNDFLRRPSLAWSPLAGLSRLFFCFSFRCFCFPFSFFCVYILVTPLMIWEYNFGRSGIPYSAKVLTLRHSSKLLLREWTSVWKWSPLSRKGGLFLQGRSTSLPPKPGLKASIP